MKYSASILALLLIHSSDASSSLRQARSGATLSDLREGATRRLEEQCTLDHNAIQSTHEINVHVTYLGQDSYWGVEFMEGSLAGLETQGWCVDLDRQLWTSTFNMDLFSAFDNDFHVDAVDKPENLPQLSYLINHFETGDIINVPIDDNNPKECVGTLTYKEFQGAIWKIIDDKNSHRTIRDRKKCIVDHLVREAALHGVEYQPSCEDPNAKVAVMLIVDDVYEIIQNQVIIAEVNLQDAGVCDCSTDFKGPPTAYGEPHFKTWSGIRYDFHGVCDLVLLQSPNFHGGLGLNIQIRTKQTKQWSYISSAVLQIGEDTLEVIGGANNPNRFLINKKFVANDDITALTLAGSYAMSFKHTNSQQDQLIVHLDGADSSGSAKVVFKTFKDMVRVDVHPGHDDEFAGSLGMMGEYESGQWMGRDQKTILDDPVAFGQEWQVLVEEAALFHSLQHSVQAPQKCVIPQYATSKERRRL